jgi:hypothetical protein
MEEISRAYEKGTGRWTGCDWPTRFGKTGLNLEGYLADEAESLANRLIGKEEGKDWSAAASWLGQIERAAEQAEEQAALAVTAANMGDWIKAVEHARRACAVEFATTRSLWKGFPLTWQPLFRAIKAAAPVQGNSN